MSAKTDRKRRASPNLTVSPEKESAKKPKLSQPTKTKEQPAVDNVSPSTSKMPNGRQSDTIPSVSASKMKPPTSQANQRLTKALFEQIPFLENDPIKALEMLKKMVQESGLGTLYANVNENTSRARDFSDRIALLKRDVQEILNFMMSGKATEQEKLEKYKEMKAIWSKIHGLNEAKVKLTQSAYDMVDRVIRRLDKELETINNEIGTEKTVSSREKGPSAMGSSFEGPVQRRARGNDFDMPVDPNEPTYCECKQISYGEMIACDNVSCPIEWFHFSCVGLTSKPKGKWFCKRCVALGQNKTSKKKKTKPNLIDKYASASDKSEVDNILSPDDSD